MREPMLKCAEKPLSHIGMSVSLGVGPSTPIDSARFSPVVYLVFLEKLVGSLVEIL